ncbi:hypothetical protein [Phaeobacter piscinae]|uniref:hypothetical protein n=1 Tax=Phaeobacter piscinae TaxID=1580596 RepID=UPI0013F4A413|nr:hypothetical protein [Phaeobacter piscinae]
MAAVLRLGPDPHDGFGNSGVPTAKEVGSTDIIADIKTGDVIPSEAFGGENQGFGRVI